MSGFDWIAPFYGRIEFATAGTILQRARAAHIERLAGRKSVLSAGEGHGRFAALFSTVHPRTSLTCVEASDRMIAAARRQTGDPANIEWIHASLPGWQPAPGAFDAIVTCFFLDCFGEESLPAVVDSLARSATRDALWLHVDFSIPPRGVVRWRARTCLALMHAFFRVGCGIDAKRLQPVAPELARHGFTRVDSKTFNFGFVTSTLWRRA
jgi:ubiquinone/menaquinone biosynthesis C-methylase UbiE